MSDADAALPLQKAILDALRTAAAVSALVGTRVYSRPSAGAAKPYVSLGPVQVLPELADEYEGSDHRIQVDGWSAGPEPTEAMKIGRAVRTALNGASLSLVDSQRLIGLTIEQTRYLTEPDGITQHAVLIFRARTEPSA